MANTSAGNGPRWRKHAVTAGVAGIAAVFGLAGALVVSGREHGPAQAPIITNSSAGTGSAAPTLDSPRVQTAFYGAETSAKPAPARVLSASAFVTPQSSAQSYPAGQQAPAPIVRGNNSSQNESLQYNTQPPAGNGDPNLDPNPQGANVDPNTFDANAPQNNPNYVDGNAQEDAGYNALAEADQAPPPLPEYDQPPAPDDNYLWTPGYWGFGSGYYWVPGAWVAPPFYGALWTPPWWGWYRGRYFFHRGYWGPHVGYYGGINYGFGYVGTGYYGGYWQGRNFFYNRAVTNVNISRVRNVYERPVVIENRVYTGRSISRISFNGPNGIQARPRPYELTALREPHYAPVQAQVQLHQMAASNRSQFFSANRGRPAEAFHPTPLSSPASIANTPPRSGFAPQGTPASPRNDANQQRTGAWQGQQGRDPQWQQQQRQAGDQQRNDQLRSQQPQQDQQRNLQFQQQQQQRPAQDQQRNDQQRNDQQRNQQLQQDQQRNLQFQQQQQQRQAQDQQRNQQLQQQQQQQRMQQQQQQRQAWEQQRNAQQQQRVQQNAAPQHIEARPSPQQQPHVEAPRPAGPQHFEGGGHRP